jgi:hypothetical protein
MDTLPGDWSRHFSSEHSSHYYYSEETGSTQWEKPTFETIAKLNHQSNKKDLKKWNIRPLKLQMPPHMLINTSKTINDQAVTSFYDINDCYSDVDEDSNDFECFSSLSPTFNVPEGNNQSFSRNQLNFPVIVGELNRDYLDMARLYKLQRPYSDKNHTKKCLLCQKRKASHVFFPCEHRCVCKKCIDSEDICVESKLLTQEHGFCNCPLCATIIKKILPFQHGKEVEKYWSWVYEVPNYSLSDEFLMVSFSLQL